MKPYFAAAGITLYLTDTFEALGEIAPAADVLVTDPPYGIAFASNRESARRASAIHGDQNTNARDEVLREWGARPAIVFGTWKIARPADVRTVLIWDKGPGVGMGDLSLPWKPTFEEIYILGRGFKGHRGESVIKGHRVVSWNRGRNHPNEKPVGLMVELLGKTEGVVIDPFAGSGSTLCAAMALGRRAIGIEIEESYCELAAKRIERQQLALPSA